jgi:hypothetical protein
MESVETTGHDHFFPSGRMSGWLKNGKSFQVSSFYHLLGNTLLFTDFAFNAGIILLFHNPDIRLYAQVVQFKVPHLRPCIIFIFQSNISEEYKEKIKTMSIISIIQIHKVPANWGSLSQSQTVGQTVQGMGFEISTHNPASFSSLTLLQISHLFFNKCIWVGWSIFWQKITWSR